MPPSTADLRRFLVEAFSDEELKALCFDYFRDVYDAFSTGMSKTQMIHIMIERCDRRDALASLEAALRAERSDQYEKRFGAPAPAVAPIEPAPAGRDARQVFISHASHAKEDAEFAHRLAADLGSAGWRAWIAPDSIQPGEKWVEAIGRGLEGSGVFVVVLTPAAVGSRWVRKETNNVIDLEVRGEVHFIPLEVEACVVPMLWNDYQRISFRGRYEDGLQALLDRLAGRVAADKTAEAMPGVGDGEIRRHEDGETRRQGDKETQPEVAVQQPPAAEPPRIEVAASALRLSGAQVKELLAALLDAFPSKALLGMMVRIELNERLDAIAHGDDHTHRVYTLITWAESTGRIDELIGKAHASNPGNARLAAFARSLPGIVVVEPASVAPQVLPAPTAPTQAQPRAEWPAAAAAAPIAFEWVTIPAGEFLMGSDKTKDKQAFDDETPQHTLILPEYRIARVPVTVAQLAAFVKATGFQTAAGLDAEKKAHHPVTNVSWHDAVAFCQWAGVRLPTEAEWEKAARGADGRIWPWGNQQPTAKLCNFNNTVKDTTPVGRYPDGASPFGVLDMAGNVWEWTSSLSKSYKYDAQDGREDPAGSGARALRGGSFGRGARRVRCACRGWLYPDDRDDRNGFRVVSPGF